jgi:hypothetical protein
MHPSPASQGLRHSSAFKVGESKSTSSGLSPPSSSRCREGAQWLMEIELVVDYLRRRLTSFVDMAGFHLFHEQPDASVHRGKPSRLSHNIKPPQASTVSTNNHSGVRTSPQVLGVNASSMQAVAHTYRFESSSHTLTCFRKVRIVLLYGVPPRRFLAIAGRVTNSAKPLPVQLTGPAAFSLAGLFRSCIRRPAPPYHVAI